MMVTIGEELVKDSYRLVGEARCLSQLFLERAYMLDDLVGHQEEDLEAYGYDDEEDFDQSHLVSLSFSKKELIQIATMLMQLANRVSRNVPS